MSLQALLGVVRHLVVERIGVDVNYEVVRHLFGLLGSGWVELAVFCFNVCSTGSAVFFRSVG